MNTSLQQIKAILRWSEMYRFAADNRMIDTIDLPMNATTIHSRNTTGRIRKIKSLLPVCPESQPLP